MPTAFIYRNILKEERRCTGGSRSWSNYSRRSRSNTDHVEEHIVCVWQVVSWWETDLSGANSATVWVAMCQCEVLLCCVGAVCVFCVVEMWPFFVSIHTYAYSTREDPH